MAITFNCGHCGKSLTTTDDKAGRKAKCPGCGEVVTVPDDGEGLDTSTGEDITSGDDLPAAPGAGTGTKTCSMCGAENPRRAKACSACGEKFEDVVGGERGRRIMDAGEVISAAWTIYKGEMGIVLGAVIVAMMVGAMASIPSAIVNFAAEFQRGQGQDATALTGLYLLLQLGSYLVAWFMNLGTAKVLLKVARGQEAQIGEVFSGGKYFLRMIGSTFVFSIMVGIGTILCIVPGVIVLLMFWPYIYVLVDEDPDGIDCLWRAKEITQGNWGAAFVMFIASFAIVLLGFLAFCVGVFLAIPLVSLIQAVAYCHMTGQRTADRG